MSNIAKNMVSAKQGSNKHGCVRSMNNLYPSIGRAETVEMSSSRKVLLLLLIHY